MKLSGARIFLLSILFLFCGLFFIHSNVNGYYACGGDCSWNPAGCAPGAQCVGSICGIYYHVCSGATCVTNGGWDQGSCNSVSCTGPGTTRTAAWTYGACTATCGLNTRVATCTCTAVNNCAVACTTPAGACTSTRVDPTCACVSQAPQEAPAGINVVQKDCSAAAASATITWTYTGAGLCGASWGYNCVDNNITKQFIIKEGAVTLATINSPTKTADITFSSWGIHIIQICASNGFASTCTSNTFTLTQPVCTISGQSPVSGCGTSFPTLNATRGACSDKTQFLITGASANCDSGWIAANSWLCPSVLGTDTYVWSARSQSTTALAKCSTPAFPAGYSISVDKTAPSVPSGEAITFSSDSTCLDKYIPTYSWNTSTDTGCSGLNSTAYWAQGSLSDTFGTVLTGWTNTWMDKIATSSSASYAPGTSIYFHARSRDTLDNQSSWSSTKVVIVPSPSPYPTINVSGTFAEDVNGVCTADVSIDPNLLTLSPVAVPNLGVSSTCTKTSTTYSCNFVIDNQRGLCVDPDIKVGMNATYEGYSRLEWRTSGTCGGAPITVTDPVANIPLYFVYGGATETGEGWFKLSETSFISRKSPRSNYLPYSMLPYDSDDTTIGKYLITNTAGNIVQNSPITLGATNKSYSLDNWYTSGYAHTDDLTYSKYIDYMKARKTMTFITNPDLSEITANGIYSISSDITLTSAQFPAGRKVVLVLEGNTRALINEDFIPTGASVAILAKDISIGSSVKEVDAILIGDTISTGISATDGLKIKGNLVDASAIQIERTQPDARKPSLFVIFDIQKYIDLLPYLSTSTYEWKQIQ